MILNSRKKLQPFPKTIIWRHRKENLKKCSLRGLESRNDLEFLTYPNETPPDLSGYVMLAMNAPVLSEADAHRGIFLIDGTWRYAGKMASQLTQSPLPRSIPSGFRTAYPRCQEDCPDPEQGLASVEALYIATLLLGRDPSGLLDQYYWKDDFLLLNQGRF
jgi:pre-rRNA-processing protein TSR3